MHNFRKLAKFINTANPALQQQMRDRWKEKTVKNPATGREVKVKSLTPEEQQKYKPQQQTQQSEPSQENLAKVQKVVDKMKTKMVNKLSTNPAKANEDLKQTVNKLKNLSENDLKTISENTTADAIGVGFLSGFITGPTVGVLATAAGLSTAGGAASGVVAGFALMALATIALTPILRKYEVKQKVSTDPKTEIQGALDKAFRMDDTKIKLMKKLLNEDGSMNVQNVKKILNDL